MQSEMQDERAAKIDTWLVSRDAQGRGRQVSGNRLQLLQQRRSRRPWNDTTCTKGKHNKAASESEGAFDVNVKEPDRMAAAPAITSCVHASLRQQHLRSHGSRFEQHGIVASFAVCCSFAQIV